MGMTVRAGANPPSATSPLSATTTLCECSTPSRPTNSLPLPTSLRRRPSIKRPNRGFRLLLRPRLIPSISGRNGTRQSLKPIPAPKRPQALPLQLPLAILLRPPSSIPRKKPQDPHRHLHYNRRNPPSDHSESSRRVRPPPTTRRSRQGPTTLTLSLKLLHLRPMRGLLSIDPSPCSVWAVELPLRCSSPLDLVMTVRSTKR